MRNFLRAIAALLPLAAILFATLPAAAAPCAPPLDETFERTYPITSTGTVSLININGSVRVEGWDRDVVEVHAVKRATKERADLSRVRIDVQTLPNAVTIRTRYAENDPASVEVEYRVRVPYQIARSHVETVNGNLVVKDVHTAGELRTVNGDIDVFEGAGRYSGKTTNGNVRVELRELDARGEMLLESVNGSVGLAVPPSANADVDAASMNGEFRTEVPLAVRSGGLGREVRGAMGRGGLAVRLRSVNGGIEIVTLRDTV